MTRTTRSTTHTVIAAGAILLTLAASPQAAAHPGQGSCRAFGQEHAFFARELGGLGRFFRDAAPLADETALEHEHFCEHA